MSLTQTSAWQKLVQHQKALQSTSLSDVILKDPKRAENCEVMLGGLRLNYAMNHVTSETMEHLAALAVQQKLEAMRERMFRGDKINTTEDRAVLHTALRQKDKQPVLVDGQDVMPDVRVLRQRMDKCVAQIREGVWKGATGQPVKDIINIGIGGSDLGPRMAVRALASYTGNLNIHFVANADAFDLLAALRKCDPATTLFVIVSKTFTTQETTLNAQTARKWLVGKLGEAAVTRHFVAVSSNKVDAEKFGIARDSIFPLWDWVGGRFSLWSAAGFSLALAIGHDNFDKLLEGAAAMDRHFCTAPLSKNMPVLLALLGIWHRNFMGARAQAILPYSERLRDVPRYLQQLEMESNGKTVTRDGETVDYATAPVILGECGTISQHSFHQWLHQGSEKVPADFIGILEDDLNHPDHHRVMMTNMIAQTGAFAFGQKKAAKPEDVYAGDRSSNLLILNRLDPYHLGLLLALYEHKVFVQGIIWNINSFDQPGVELGKHIARGLATSGNALEKDKEFLNGFFDHMTMAREKSV